MAYFTLIDDAATQSISGGFLNRSFNRSRTTTTTTNTTDNSDNSDNRKQSANRISNRGFSGNGATVSFSS